MDSVKVAIRIRPLISRETGTDILWTADTHQIRLKEGKSKPYIFDRVFDSDEATNDVYEEIVEPIVQSAMGGFNGTVFAYGQTSSGKTYTMMGTRENPGIVPLSVKETFDLIQKTPEREFLLRVSYMEIYNEVVKDLFCTATDSPGLQIREDEFRNAVVHGLTEKLVMSPSDVLKLMEMGEKRRHTGCTNMNERSSRSHTIFRMIIESRERAEPNHTRDSLEIDTAVKVSQLNLVDLAGSERAGQTGAEGQRFKEGCHINKSLSTLGLVINQICKASESGQSAPFISYRDSKLTRILQPSLGGNSLTAIICAVTPASMEDTDSTLKFASSAKKIKNKPHVNEVLSDEALLYRQKREINQLKKKIQEMELKACRPQTSELQELLDEKEKLRKEQEEKIDMLKKIILVSTQPADSKKQRSVRRETWCPGALAAASGRSPPWKRMDLDSTLTAINQSVVFQNMNQTLIQGQDGSKLKKKTQFADEAIPSPKKKMKMTKFADDVDAAQEASFKFSTLEDELLEMRKRQETLEEELEEAKAEKNKHLQEKDNLQLKLMRMDGRIQMTQEAMDDLIKEKGDLEEENEKLERKMKDQSARISDYMQQEIVWRNSHPDVAALQNENQDLVDQLKDMCHQNRKLQEQADSERDDHEYLKSVMEDFSKEASETQKSLNSQLGECKNQITLLQNQLESTFANNSHSPTALVDIHKLETELEQVKEELKRKDKELEMNIAENEKLKLQLKDFSEESDGKSLQRSSDEELCDNQEKEDIREKLEAQLQENQILRSQLAESSEHMLDKKNHDELLSSLDDLKQELALKDAEIEELKQMATDNKPQADLNESVKIGEKTFSEALSSCEALIEERDEARNECKKLHGQIEILEKHITTLKNDITVLEELDEFLKAEKEMLFEQEKENKQEIERLKNELSEVRTSNIENSHASVNTLTDKEQENKLQNLREEVCSLMKSSEDAQFMLQEANKKLSLASDERDSEMKKNDSLEKELKRLRSEVESFDTMAELTKEKYERREKELCQQLQSVYDQLGGDISETKGGDKIPDDKVISAAYEQEVEDLKRQIETYAEKLSDSEKRILEYEERVKETATLEKVEKSDTELYLEENDLTLEELKERIEELKHMTTERNELDEKCEEHMEKVTELEELLKMKVKDYEDMAASNRELDSIIAEQKNKLEDLQSDSKQANEESLKMNPDEIQSLQERITEKEMEITNVRDEMESMMNQKDEIIGVLKEELDVSQKNLEELRLQYSKLEEIQNASEGSTLKMNKDAQKSLDEIKTLQETISEKEVEVTKMKNEMETMTSQKDEVIQLLKKDLDASQKGLEELKLLQPEFGSDEGHNTEKVLREELVQARRELAEMGERYNQLHTVTEHAQGALLAETNKELDQKRLLEIAERERKESVADFALERESANKQISELSQKVNELQTALCKSNVDKDLAVRQGNKASEECEFLRKHVKELENIHQNEPSVIPRNATLDPDKMVVKIKQLSLNLELTKQSSEKLTVSNKKLQEENRHLESEIAKFMNLHGEVTRLEALLGQERELRREEDNRSKMRLKEIEDMRDKLCSQQSKIMTMKSELSQNNSKISQERDVANTEKQQLQNQLTDAKTAIAQLHHSIKDLHSKEEEFTMSLKEEQNLIENLREEIEQEKLSKKELEEKLESFRTSLENSIEHLNREKQKFVDLEKCKDSALLELENMQQDLDSKQKELQEEASKKVLMEQSIEHLKTALDKARFESNEIIKSKDLEICDLLDRVSGFEQNENVETNLKKQLENLQESASRHRSENEALLTRIEELEQAQTEHLKTQSCMKNWQEKYNILLKEKEELQEQLNLNTKLQNQSFEEQGEEERSLEEKLKEMERLRDDAILNREEIERNMCELAVERDNLLKEIEEKSCLENKIIALNEELDKATQKLDQNIQYHEKLILERNELIEAKESEIQSLHDRMNTVSNASQGFDQNLCSGSENENIIAQLRSEISTLESKCTELEAKMSTQTQEPDDRIENEKNLDQHCDSKDVCLEENQTTLVLELQHALKQKEEMIEKLQNSAVNESDGELNNEPSQLATDALMQENLDLKASLEDLQSQVNDKALLIQRVEEFEALLNDKNAEIESLVQKTSEASTASSSPDSDLFNGELESLNAALLQKQEEIGSLQERCEQLEKDVNEKNLSVNDTNTNNDDGVGFAAGLDQELIETLSEQVADLKIQLQEKDEHIADLLQEIDSFKSHVDPSLSNMQPSSDAANVEEEYKKRIEELNEQISGQKALITQLELSKKETEKELLRLESLHSTKEEAVSDMKRQLLDLQKSLEHEDPCVSKLRKAKELIEEELSRVKSENENLVDCVSSKEESLEKSQGKLLSLTEELNTQTEKLKESMSETSNLSEQCEMLKVSLSSSEETVSQVRSSLDEITSQNMKLEEEIKESQKAKEKLEICKAELESQLETMKSEIDKVQNSQTGENSKLVAEVEEHKQKAVELEVQLNDVFSMIREKAEEMEQSALSREALERDFKILTQENEDLKSSQNLKTEEISVLQDELEVSKSMIETMEAKIEELTQLKDSSSKEIEDMKNQKLKLEESMKMKDEHVLEINDLKVRIKNSEDEASKLRNQLISISEKKDEAEVACEDMRKKISDLETHLKLMEDTQMIHVDSEDRLRQMELQITELSESKDTLQLANEGLRQENTDLETEKKQMESSHKSDLELEQKNKMVVEKQLELIQTKLESTTIEKQHLENELDKLKTQMQEISKTHLKEMSTVTEKGEDLCLQLTSAKKQADEEMEKLKGFLYKKELEVQSMEVDINNWGKRYEALKNSLEEAVVSAKEEMSKRDEENSKKIYEMEERLLQSSKYQKEIENLKQKFSDIERKYKQERKTAEELSQQIKAEKRRNSNLVLELKQATKKVEEKDSVSLARLSEERAKSKTLQEKLAHLESEMQKVMHDQTKIKEREAANTKSDERNKMLLEEVSAAKKKCEDYEKIREEAEKEYTKNLDEAKAQLKTSQMKLIKRIGSLENNLIEADKELEEEKARNKELMEKLEENESNSRTGAVRTRSSTNKPGDLERMTNLCEKVEAKYKEEKLKTQALSKQLKTEKEKCSKLVARLEDAAVRRTTDYTFPNASDVDCQLHIEKENNKKLADKLAKIEKEFSQKMETAEEHFKVTKKRFVSRIQSLEDNCNELDQELEQEKTKCEELERKKKVAEKQLVQLKQSLEKFSSKGKCGEELLRRQLLEKEEIISNLELKIMQSTAPLEKKIKELKKELDESEGKISDLMQLRQGDQKDSESGYRTRSATNAASSISQPYRGGSGGLVVNDTKVYVLEMEICGLQKRIKHLEKELGKYKDIEAKRRSENLELLEENHKFRAIIKNSRERKKTANVLAENPGILNEGPKESSSVPSVKKEEVPASYTDQDDKCKNQ